jgi:nucleoside-diphosphate-sugar epimerase
VWRNVTPTFIWKSLNGESLPLDNGGEVSRDFIFVDDICRGLIACAIGGKPGEAYNIASGVETTIRELAEAITKTTGNTAPLDIRPAREWDKSGRRFGSTEKSRRELGFEARVSIAEGIERTVQWTKDNQGVISRCIDKHEEQMRAVTSL